MTLTPEEVSTWERLAPKGYRAVDQDPRTVYRLLYGQDTPPAADAKSMRDGPTGALRTKLGMKA